MLVAAHAAGVSRIDFKISSGKVRQLFCVARPRPTSRRFQYFYQMRRCSGASFLMT
jgi:hypothetical protein